MQLPSPCTMSLSVVSFRQFRAPKPMVVFSNQHGTVGIDISTRGFMHGSVKSSAMAFVCMLCTIFRRGQHAVVSVTWFADYYLNGYWYDSAYLRVVHHGANSTLVILISESSRNHLRRPASHDIIRHCSVYRSRLSCPCTLVQPIPQPPRFCLSPLLWDNSSHKCMFPGFLVVYWMNYGGSTTNARPPSPHWR